MDKLTALNHLKSLAIKEKEYVNNNISDLAETTLEALTEVTNTMISTDDKGIAGGVASLGEDGKIPTTQLPNYLSDDATLLASNLGDMSGTSLSESAYNFKFLALQVTTGTFILLPILPNQTMAQGSVSVYTAEAYDTYTFASGLYTNGTVFGDNRNLRITTTLGNPASASGTSYTITAIYGLCRRAS